MVFFTILKFGFGSDLKDHEIMQPILQNCPILLHQTHEGHGKVLLALVLGYSNSDGWLHSETVGGEKKHISKINMRGGEADDLLDQCV